VRAFVQARMSSRRFPGKVLAPFRGKPLIWHVTGAVARALPSVPLVVATSDEASDDPLAAYVRDLGFPVFRGPRDDVFERFRRCLGDYPCDWILRVNADSPLLSGHVLRTVHGLAAMECDVVTTTAPRTFPRGQNLELIRTTTFAAVDPLRLTDEDREHVTRYFYRHPDEFQIVNVESGDAQLSGFSVAVDTIEDLQRLERLSEEGLRDLCNPPHLAGQR